MVAFSSIESRFAPFNPELTASYLSVKLFRYFVESHPFVIFTDHAIFTQASKTEQSPRQAIRLDFLAQFTMDVEVMWKEDVRNEEENIYDFNLKLFSV